MTEPCEVKVVLRGPKCALQHLGWNGLDPSPVETPSLASSKRFSSAWRNATPARGLASFPAPQGLSLAAVALSNEPRTELPHRPEGGGWGVAALPPAPECMIYNHALLLPNWQCHPGRDPRCDRSATLRPCHFPAMSAPIHSSRPRVIKSPRTRVARTRKL